MIKLSASSNWVIQAVKESLAQPLGKKLKHLKYRLLWEIRPWLKWPGAVPLAVDIESASLCNFKCTFCQQSAGEETSSEWWRLNPPKKLMPWDIFKKIVDECSRLGVYSMKLNWRGEPTLNPHLPEMVSYMKQQGIHEVQMNTNASLLTPSLSDRLITSGLDRIIFSCDGLSKETYNTLRRGGDFQVFDRNVRMFRERCNAHRLLGLRTPVVRINVAIMAENKHEIPGFEGYFKGIADEIRYNTLYNPQQANELLGGRMRQVKRRGCPQIYQRMLVSTEGDVVPCCADYMKKLKLGNVDDKPLGAMYLDGQARIRKTHERHQARRLSGCADCDLFMLSSRENGRENGKVVWTNSKEETVHA